MDVCHAKAGGYLNKWGGVSDACEYTSPSSGWKGKLKVKWAVKQGSACVQAREGKAKNPDKWQSLSCGPSGEGTVKWPKNTASKLEVRVMSQKSPTVGIQYSI